MPKSVFLFGDERVNDSLSPAILNAMFKHKGIDCKYETKVLDTEFLKFRSELDKARKPNVLGFNATIPLKSIVAKHVDELEQKASDIGAVSCVVNENGHLKGYNTDLYGFLKPVEMLLSDNRDKLSGKQVVIFGNGGAASAIAYGAYRRGANVAFIGREKSHAKSAAQKIYMTVAEGHYGGLEDLSSFGGGLLVNATPVGMVSNPDESLATRDQLRKFEYVFDVVSNPEETKMLKLAKSVGCKTISGLDMLVYQAARSFQLWTGQEPDVELMFKAAREALNRKQ